MVTYPIWKVYLFAIYLFAVYLFDKKPGRDNSLVVVVLQQLSPVCPAHICTLDKRVEADHRLTALECRCGL